jgi:hypothetical protein
MLLRSGRIVGSKDTNDLSSNTMTTGKILEFTKNIGDYIIRGDTIAIIEASGIPFHLKTIVSGVIVDFKLSPGNIIKIGDTIAIVNNPLNKLLDDIRQTKNKTWDDIDHFINEFDIATRFYSRENAILEMAMYPSLRDQIIQIVSQIYSELLEIPMFLTTKEPNIRLVRLAVKKAKEYQSSVIKTYKFFNKTILPQIKKVEGYVEGYVG